MGFDDVGAIQAIMSSSDSVSDWQLHLRMYEEKVLLAMGITPDLLEANRREESTFNEFLKREAALQELIDQIVFVGENGELVCGGADFNVAPKKAEVAPPEFNRVLDL